LSNSAKRSIGRSTAFAAIVIAACSGANAQQAYAPGAGTEPAAYSSLASQADLGALRRALNAARTGDIAGAHAAMDAMQDPTARKVALWALADTSADSLGFSEIDQARQYMAGWPREARRLNAAEKKIATAGLSPKAIIAWFGSQQPRTAEGAMTLAQAYIDDNQTAQAAALIRDVWRNQVFEADSQSKMLGRFGSWLTPEDHARRADILLYGAQGPAARDMLPLLDPDTLAMANARIALRSNAYDAEVTFSSLTPVQQVSPGVAFERASNLRKRNQIDEALRLSAYFPAQPPTEEAADRIWIERRALIAQALKNGDSANAYGLAANSRMTSGANGAEAQFYAGWQALTRLKNPTLAEAHFAVLAGIGVSPITRSRALYWQGRAAEAGGDSLAAAGYFGDGARYQTTFYGQLAAEKAGLKTIDLGADPTISPADRATFEGRDIVKAARMLNAVGAVDAFKAFVLAADDLLPNAAEEAMLFDLALTTGDQDLAMRAARTAATRGFILPQRGYPIISTPEMPTSAETAFTLSIARQESNFTPTARSGVGARGMMQLMPATARLTARRIGEPYAESRLIDPQYNMRLGSAYLGRMIDTFSGSYLMAAAAYNAGPSRPLEWAGFCGDPRNSSNDPLDYIECIPFSETRNYVMRTLESTVVYRARLNGGTAPLTLWSDLKRGSALRVPSTPIEAVIDKTAGPAKTAAELAAAATTPSR